MQDRGGDLGGSATSEQLRIINAKLAELQENGWLRTSESGDRAALESGVGPAILVVPWEAAGLFPTKDPLISALGRGVRLQDLLNFIWPGTEDHYLSANLGRLLAVAGVRASDDHIVRPRHLFDVVLHPQIEQKQLGGMPTLPKLRHLLRQVTGAGDLDLGHFEFPSEEFIASSVATAVVGPELVEILLLTSWLRERTNASYRDVGVRHFVAALLLVEIGRVALDAAGLTRPTYSSLRDSLAEMVERDAPYYADLGDDPKMWRSIVNDMRATTLRERSAGETHAFANDRTDIDLLGSRRDAVALANLLLLKDLAPPLAIGIFGPWGSGKSTLMRLVQKEIENRPAANKVADGKIVQIRFDAWSHADAENLWASLTAEMFDQLADAIDGREADGKLRTGLITEIAKRLRKEADAKPLAAHEIETQRAVVKDAETTLAGLEHEPVMAAVADEMAKDLIAKATPKQLSDDDKKNLDKVKEVKEATENKERLEELLQACGVSKNERDPEKLAPIISGLFLLPTHVAVLFVLLRRGFARGVAYGVGSAFVLLLVGVLGALWQFGWGRVPELWAYVVAGLPSLAILGTLIGGAAVTMRSVAPILKLASDFLARKEKRAAELNSKRREAQEALKKEREKLESILAEQKKEIEFAETYSIAAEGRSRESLLRYFIAFSPELAEVRKKLGLLATVRRCFETLEQIMREKHGTKPADGATQSDSSDSMSSGEKAKELAHVPDVKRIIVYIDDLDRCSERHVVQVLEAIHLLLSFDLFVVVVAVDARWLHRAVGQIYRDQLSGADTPALRNAATVADYLEKIFQLPFWMQPISNPDTVERFVRGIDKPREQAADQTGSFNKAQHGDEGRATIGVVDAQSDPSLLQNAVERRATMSDRERRALQSMALLAGKSPRGLKRLVNTYRLIRVMRGPKGVADLEGSESKTPEYPYILFALACEVGLSTESASLVAEIAARKAASDGYHPLIACLIQEEDLDLSLDPVQARLRERLNADRVRGAVQAAVRAVYLAASGQDPLESGSADPADVAPLRSDPALMKRGALNDHFAAAFAEAARFTFRSSSL